MGSFRPSNFRYLTSVEDSEHATGDSPGGFVLPFKAGAALLVGDPVFLSAAHTVNKSGTIADYVTAIGVVVGGTNTNMEVLQDDIDMGVSAADADETVLVCILGKCKVLCGDTVSLGDKLIADATSGRVDAGAITTDLVAGNSGSILGTALEDGVDGDYILALINIH